MRHAGGGSGGSHDRQAADVRAVKGLSRKGQAAAASVPSLSLCWAAAGWYHPAAAQLGAAQLPQLPPSYRPSTPATAQLPPSYPSYRPSYRPVTAHLPQLPPSYRPSTPATAQLPPSYHSSAYLDAETRPAADGALNDAQVTALNPNASHRVGGSTWHIVTR